LPGLSGLDFQQYLNLFSELLMVSHCRVVLPDIPTVSEFVPGYEASIWWGIPTGIVDRLNREINAGLRSQA
jgi:hypothetical protein